MYDKFHISNKMTHDYEIANLRNTSKLRFLQ